MVVPCEKRLRRWRSVAAVVFALLVCGKAGNDIAPSANEGIPHFVPEPVKYQASDGYEYSVHPISFCLPKELFVQTIQPKVRGVSASIPGNEKTYSIRDKYRESDSSYSLQDAEQEYLSLYRGSYFGVTRCKSGWDTLRHVEILASGCLPLWIDLDFMPKSIGVFYPRALIREAMGLPGLHIGLKEKGGTAQADNPDMYKINGEFYKPEVQQRYFELATAALEHTRTHLTTEGMARYMLSTLTDGYPERIRNVLYIAEMRCDYLGVMLLHGFKSLLGAEHVTDVWLFDGKLDSNSGVKHEVLYSSADTLNGTRAKEWTLMTKKYYYKGAPIHPYAQGFMYAFKLPDSPKVNRHKVEARLQAREWDAVVFGIGSLLKDLTLLEMVRDAGYDQKHVAVAFGTDKP